MQKLPNVAIIAQIAKIQNLQIVEKLQNVAKKLEHDFETGFKVLRYCSKKLNKKYNWSQIHAQQKLSFKK